MQATSERTSSLRDVSALLPRGLREWPDKHVRRAVSFVLAGTVRSTRPPLARVTSGDHGPGAGAQQKRMDAAGV
jgi:hypothetical protein